MEVHARDAVHDGPYAVDLLVRLRRATTWLHDDEETKQLLKELSTHLRCVHLQLETLRKEVAFLQASNARMCRSIERSRVTHAGSQS